MKLPFYNAHHAPIGAFATFTLGCKENKGGIGLELAGPADENLYIGIEDQDQPGSFRAFPFYKEAENRADDFDVEHLSGFTSKRTITPFNESEIEREMGASIDEWRADDLVLRLISPVQSIPDPDQSTGEALKNALTPAVWVELTVDNRGGSRPRRAFFGYQGSDRQSGMRLIDEEGLIGIAQGVSTGIATTDKDVYAGVAFQAERILAPESAENLHFLVGDLGLLVGTVESGEIHTFRFAVCFFKEGTATTGMRTRYFYRRYFETLESVMRHALSRFDVVKQQAALFDERLRSKLSDDRHWMLAHAIRSYFGSTQLLEGEGGQPIWVVNEGEYRMMNTFDLTVDQAFFELALNPWTVRNVLDLYVERYSYVDGLRRPSSEQVYPGGISFTHDMGVSNVFSRPTFSGYEQTNLRGCFSYMSAEELMNWILTGALYEGHSNDLGWAVSQLEVFLACFRSLVARDDPDPMQRNGLVGFDTARCNSGSEITTYDSLDTSLGQARNSLYLGVKAWACYVVLESIFTRHGAGTAAEQARGQASKAIDTIIRAAGPDGLLPAVVGEGVEARIIPAIEALVYPYMLGLPIDSQLKETLSRHLDAVLKPGVCLFTDGAWKLSSTSKNSWLSKIYLCQFVSEQILGKTVDHRADAAHRAWLQDPDNAYYAWSDQMLDGKAVGSRYYPRGVTCILWACESDQPLRDLANLLTESAFDFA